MDVADDGSSDKDVLYRALRRPRVSKDSAAGSGREEAVRCQCVWVEASDAPCEGT